jgi:hypothetical protein
MESRALQPSIRRIVSFEAPMSHLRQLVANTFRPVRQPAGMMQDELEVALFADAARPGPRAVAYGGAGLDLMGGECLLLALGTHSAQRGFEHRLAAAITNRRTLVGGWSNVKGPLNDVRRSILHDDVLRCDLKRGLINVKFDVVTHHGTLDLQALYGHCTEFDAFFKGLTQIPAGHRAEPPMSPPAPSEGDPTGARAAMASLWFADEHAHQLLELAAAGVEDGALDPATAADMVARVVLAHRTACSGPAGYGTSFLSPLSADDLGNVLARALGRPSSYAEPQPGLHWLDFAVDPSGRSIGGALKALGVASYLGLGVGFSPGRMIAGEMMKKQPVTAVRFQYADVPGGCAYEMYANGVRLENAEAEMAHGIHELLLHSAWPVLERRCQVGWQLPYAQLSL